MTRVVNVHPRNRLSTDDMADLERHPDVARLIAARASFDPSRRLSAADVAAVLRHPDVVPTLEAMFVRALEEALPVITQRITNQIAQPVAQAVFDAVAPATARGVAEKAGRQIAFAAFQQGRDVERKRHPNPDSATDQAKERK